MQNVHCHSTNKKSTMKLLKVNKKKLTYQHEDLVHMNMVALFGCEWSQTPGRGAPFNTKGINDIVFFIYRLIFPSPLLLC